MRLRGRVLVVLMLNALSVTPASASLFDTVAKAEGVNPTILFGIALQESKPPSLVMPWPWAVNLAGKSYYFATKADAINFVKPKIQQNPKLSIDIGIGQTNWRWHGDKFASIESAFDPRTNLTVASRILKSFNHHDIWTAVGKYHCPSDQAWCVRKARKYAHSVRNQLIHFLKTQKKSQQKLKPRKAKNKLEQSL